MHDNSRSAAICVQTKHTVWNICKHLLAIYLLHQWRCMTLAGGLTSTSSCIFSAKLSTSYIFMATNASSICGAFFIIIFYRTRRQAIWSKGAFEILDLPTPNFEMQKCTIADQIFCQLKFIFFLVSNMEIPMKNYGNLEIPPFPWTWKFPCNIEISRLTELIQGKD